jgi:RNA-directed DNA polymerase
VPGRVEAALTKPRHGSTARWCGSGERDEEEYAQARDRGTPQGSAFSPLLLNVALRGMEHAAGVRYQTSGLQAGVMAPGSPTVVRYADDLIALCHSKHEAEQVKARLAERLAPRGLVFNEDKTHVVTLAEGFDFLGFTVRRQSGKLLIKPSEAALRRIRERLRTEMRALRGANAFAVVKRLNPIIRGWAAYYRTVVSSKIFQALDAYVWKLAYKWAKHSHQSEPKRWIVSRYFGAFDRSRPDLWVFRLRDGSSSSSELFWSAWRFTANHRLRP